jgi:hypothetical protein
VGVVKARVLLEQFVDDGVVLFERDSLAFGLDGTADLFLEDGDVACLLLQLAPPSRLHVLQLQVLHTQQFPHLACVFLPYPTQLPLMFPLQL